ncbi:MAG TPA: aldo/keto reductase [Nitrososphaerales archaeon]|nr:aldo/keto reductase [Nitrososphaerales archaeon]
MQLKGFAKSARQISEVGIGTYYDPLWIATAFLGWRRGSTSKVKSMEAGLEGGVTLVDTAEIYGSEPLVARAIGGRKREDLFIASKVSPIHLHRDALRRSFEKSLRRLGTSYLDLYQVHWPNPRVPISETMGVMGELVKEGKLRFIGVSNFSLAKMKEAQSALDGVDLSSVQLDYSLINRSVERDILPYCDSQGIALLAYYPLGHGKLVSDSRLDEMAKKYGKTRSQVALRWLSRKKNVFPIPRASRVDHVRENAGASGWDMTDSESDALAQKFG